MSRRTALIAVACVAAIFLLFVILAKTSNAYANPDIKHGPMELFGLGPELFAERAIAWVKGVSAIIKEGISELGIVVAALLLFVQNYRKGRQLDEKIDDAKKEIAQRFSAQGQRIHEVAMAVTPTNGSAPEAPPAV